MIVALTAAVGALALEAFALAGLDPQVIGWENRTATPPADGRPWAVETLRTGPITAAGDGFAGVDQADPFYQLTLQVPANEGTGLLDRLSAAVLTAFRPRREVQVRDDAGRLVLTLRCVTAEPGPIANGIANGWTARPMRMGLHAVAPALHVPTDAPLAVALTV